MVMVRGVDKEIMLVSCNKLLSIYFKRHTVYVLWKKTPVKISVTVLQLCNHVLHTHFCGKLYPQMCTANIMR